MPVTRLVLSTAFAVFWMTCRLQAAGHDPLLDEVIAGASANLARIQFGTAIYDWKHTSHGNEERESRETIVVHFDGSKTRIDTPISRSIIDDTRCVDFDYRGLDTKDQNQPFNYSAIIRDKRFAAPHRVHPRFQGVPQYEQAESIADVLRAVMDRPEISITAKKDGDTIYILRKSTTHRHISEYTVDTKLGYVTTHYLSGNLPPSEYPANEVVTEVTRGPGGAYLAKRWTTTWRVMDRQFRVSMKRSETELVDFSAARPNPQLFTIDGLGLPVGADVQDRVHNRGYVFGVTPVSEDMELRAPQEPALARHLWIAAPVVLLFIPLLWWLVAFKCRT